MQLSNVLTNIFIKMLSGSYLQASITFYYIGIIRIISIFAAPNS